MNLIGTRYATFQAGPLLVKAQDLTVPDRLPVRCYRETLGYQLGTRLGLSIPATELVVHPQFGRISTQRWLEGARSPSPQRLADIRFEPVGTRILLLDLLVANADRRDANLLELYDTIVPIDFNVGFGFAADVPRTEDPDLTIMRWFGTVGVTHLPPHGLEHLATEVARFEHLLSESYIRFAVEKLPDQFVGATERERLLHGLLLRRTSIGPWIRDWWHRIVEPIHRLNEVKS